MKQILFSCAGTTDPVRGEHDGPMLHILRHYRPEAVYVFLTPEIRDLARGDDRFEKTRAWISEHWGGYQPEFHYIESDVVQAQDMDALYEPMTRAVVQACQEDPEAEVLLHVTSGTPQMQVILSQLAMDMRYRTRGIQVTNFEKKAGRTTRTNDKQYDVDLELAFNEDEQPGAANRCLAPRMYAMRREYLRRQITTLLDMRNFDAVEELQDSLPAQLQALVQHLAARNRLEDQAARQWAGKVGKLPFPLYAYRGGSRGAYSEASEYYLMTKNLVAAGNYTQFLLHLSPLVLTLQLAVLDRLLEGTGCAVRDFVLRENRNHQVFYPQRLREKLPELYAHYEARVMEARVGDVSTYLCDMLLSWFPNEPAAARTLFAHYASLKDLRNQLAHTLQPVAREEIGKACGAEPEQLLKEIEKTLIEAYPACEPSVFHVYDRAIEYLKSRL